MPKPHPIELRARVVAAHKAGEGSFKDLADRFMVGEASVNRWVALERRTGSVAPRPMGGANSPRMVDEVGELLLMDLLDNNSDCTLVELCEAYEDARSIRVSSQTMSTTVRRLGYTRKRGSSGGSVHSGQTWWQPARRS